MCICMPVKLLATQINKNKYSYILYTLNYWDISIVYAVRAQKQKINFVVVIHSEHDSLFNIYFRTYIITLYVYV